MVVGALVAGTAALATVFWDRLFPVAPEKLVEVVWTHDCPCASRWIESLRAEGFIVRDFEMDDLSTFRRRWQMPGDAKGCHPAAYIGYFIDGDVPPDALRKLARDKPEGYGLLQAALHDDHSSQAPLPREAAPILFLDGALTLRTWGAP